MKIAILSRGPQLYSTQSLIRAGIKRGHEMHVVDHTRCSLVLERDRPRILYQGYRLERFDAVIPRIGASVTSIGASVISQFENMNVFVAANAAALIEARDKLRCLHRLAQHGIQIPKTVFVASGQNMQAAVSQLGGLPVVVAAMERQARPGEFRSNLHRGGSARQVKLTPEEQELAVRVVQIMGLHVGGVDFLRSERGPLIMEVNASPGLEGIETVTGINVAGRIIQFIEETLAQSS